MANTGPLTSLGNVVRKRKSFMAAIDTKCEDERYSFTGPPRNIEQHAREDLQNMRTSTEGALTRREGLLLMRSTAESLREKARV